MSSMSMKALCGLLPFYQFGRVYTAIAAIAYSSELDATVSWVKHPRSPTRLASRHISVDSWHSS